MIDPFFQPVSGTELPRYAGVASFMRLPVVGPDHPRRGDVEIGLVGLPYDGGTSMRPGARHGPRALRDASTMIRAQHPVSGIRPFEARRIADMGDIGPNPVDMTETLKRFETAYADLRARDIRPLTAGGDHLCALPCLRGLAREAPLGLIQFDSHTDLYAPYYGGTALSHGNPFRLAVEEGLVDPEAGDPDRHSRDLLRFRRHRLCPRQRHPHRAHRRAVRPRHRGRDGRGARDRG